LHGGAKGKPILAWIGYGDLPNGSRPEWKYAGDRGDSEGLQKRPAIYG
jgi:hypothetical protein